MDDGRRNTFGGFCPNYRGTIFYTPSLDEIDNPGFLKELNNVNLSTAAMAYSAPKLPDSVYCHPTTVKRSGYNNYKSLHRLPLEDRKEAHRERIIAGDSFYSGCVLPPYEATTETRESFSDLSLINKDPCPKSQYLDPPGNRDTGFTHDFSGLNTLDGRVLDPIFFGMKPDLGRMGHSIMKGDYLPWKILHGREHSQFLSDSPLTKVTAYNRFKELDPCFAGKFKRGECDKLESVYVHDYPWKSSRCNTIGKEVYGKGMNSYGGPPDLNLFQGGAYYVSETTERFQDPGPREGRPRHGHLRGAVLLPISKSGFSGAYDDMKHAPFAHPCGPADKDMAPLEPHRYNPWPRFMTSYRGMLDHNYRPHPTTPAANYELQKLQDGTVYEGNPALF